MSPEAPTPADPRIAHQQWRKARFEFVTSPLGNLALVQTTWQQPGEQQVSDEDALAGEPATAQLTRLSRRNIDTGEIEHGYRIWRQDSPANAAFDLIETYDYDPDWVIDASFEYVDDNRVVPFEHIRDGGQLRGLPVSGDLVFTRDGTEYRLSAFDTGEKLQLVFGDTTNGAESYGAGRFLYVQKPAIADDEVAGTRHPVTLDFNYAFVPPCGFSSQMNCPLPPAQNRFAVPVRAGERDVAFRDGYTLH